MWLICYFRSSKNHNEKNEKKTKLFQTALIIHIFIIVIVILIKQQQQQQQNMEIEKKLCCFNKQKKISKRTE